MHECLGCLAVMTQVFIVGQGSDPMSHQICVRIFSVHALSFISQTCKRVRVSSVIRDHLKIVVLNCDQGSAFVKIKDDIMCKMA